MQTFRPVSLRRIAIVLVLMPLAAFAALKESVDFLFAARSFEESARIGYYGQNLIDQWMIPFFGASGSVI